MIAWDSVVRHDRYWVGPFEDMLIELGARAAHWEIEENDGTGSLLDGFNHVGPDGYPVFGDAA